MRIVDSKLFVLVVVAIFALAACDSDTTVPAEPIDPAEETEPTEEEVEVDEEALEEEESAEDEADDSLAAPDNVAEPPEDAEVTESGLASIVLQEGEGEEHPTATSMVEVHYTGWTTDGEMFDSSVARGNPTSFPLNQVIAGWTEGLQLMVVGEKRRFWIPEELAYRGQRAPYGLLVFDVELLEIR